MTDHHYLISCVSECETGIGGHAFYAHRYEVLGQGILEELARREAAQQAITDAIEERIAFDARIEQKLAAAGYKDSTS